MFKYSFMDVEPRTSHSFRLTETCIWSRLPGPEPVTEFHFTDRGFEISSVVKVYL